MRTTQLNERVLYIFRIVFYEWLSKVYVLFQKVDTMLKNNILMFWINRKLLKAYQSFSQTQTAFALVMDSSVSHKKVIGHHVQFWLIVQKYADLE